MNIVAGALAGTGPGAGWRLGADEAAANHCVTHTMIPFDTTQITSATNRSNPQAGDPCHPLARGAHAPAIAIGLGSDPISSEELAHPVTRRNGDPGTFAQGTAVRRLMPVECERLQGFPDGHTAIMWRGKPAADGPRYKALGNSWAVNCARWLGRRIEAVESIKPHNVADDRRLQAEGRKASG